MSDKENEIVSKSPIKRLKDLQTVLHNELNSFKFIFPQSASSSEPEREAEQDSFDGKKQRKFTSFMRLDSLASYDWNKIEETFDKLRDKGNIDSEVRSLIDTLYEQVQNLANIINNDKARVILPESHPRIIQEHDFETNILIMNETIDRMVEDIDTVIPEIVEILEKTPPEKLKAS